MKPITVETTINQPIEKIWEYWTNPEHITKWTFASPDWHAPHATNDLRIGGKFLTRMEAVDGSQGFDFEGTYTQVEEFKKIQYEFGGRIATIDFIPQADGSTKIGETFDPEDLNTEELQRQGWKSILESFKAYVSKE